MSDAARIALSGRRAPVSLASAQQKPNFVTVLGVDNHSIALCSNVLQVLGVRMTQVDGARARHPQAPGGNATAAGGSDWNDLLLSYFNRDGLNPLPLPVAWWADPRVVSTRQEIAAFLKETIGDAPIGCADRRIMRLFPVWKQLFNDLKINPKIVLCLRNPRQAARELSEQSSCSTEIGEYLWFVYMTDFLRHSGSYDLCVIEYDDWHRDANANARKLREFVAAEAAPMDEELELALPQLIGTGPWPDDTGEAVQPIVRLLYKLLHSVESDDEARAQARRLATEFFSFQQFQLPLYRALDEAAGRDRALAQLAQDAGVLRAMLEDIERAHNATKDRVEALQQERDYTAQALGQADAELAELRAVAASREVEAAAAEELAGARGGALAAAEDELDGLRAYLEKTQQELSEAMGTRAKGADAQARLESDLTEARSALAEAAAASCAAEDRFADAQAKLAEVQTELAASRQRLSEIAGERDAHADDAARRVAALETEIEDARRRIEELEREQDELRSTAARTEAELAEAQATLGARETALAEAEDRIATADARQSELEAEVEEQNRLVGHLEWESREQENARASTEAELAAARAALLEREAALSTAAGQAAGVELQLAEIQTRTQGLEHHLDEARRERDAQNAARSQLEAELHAHKASLVEWDASLSAVEGLLVDAESSIVAAPVMADSRAAAVEADLADMDMLTLTTEAEASALRQRVAETEALPVQPRTGEFKAFGDGVLQRSLRMIKRQHRLRHEAAEASARALEAERVISQSALSRVARAEAERAAASERAVGDAAHLLEAMAQLTELKEAEAGTLADLAFRRVRIGELEDIVAEHARALATAQTEVANLREAFSDLERSATALNAALHDRDLVASAAEERASLTEGRLAQAQQELSTAQANLAAAERSLEERAATERSLQQRVALLAAAETEAAQLGRQLAASRRIRRELLMALRKEPARPNSGFARRRWWNRLWPARRKPAEIALRPIIGEARP